MYTTLDGVLKWLQLNKKIYFENVLLLVKDNYPLMSNFVFILQYCHIVYCQDVLLLLFVHQYITLLYRSLFSTSQTGGWHCCVGKEWIKLCLLPGKYLLIRILMSFLNKSDRMFAFFYIYPCYCNYKLTNQIANLDKAFYPFHYLSFDPLCTT